MASRESHTQLRRSNVEELLFGVKSSEDDQGCSRAPSASVLGSLAVRLSACSVAGVTEMHAVFRPSLGAQLSTSCHCRLLQVTSQSAFCLPWLGTTSRGAAVALGLSLSAHRTASHNPFFLLRPLTLPLLPLTLLFLLPPTPGIGPWPHSHWVGCAGLGKERFGETWL